MKIQSTTTKTISGKKKSHQTASSSFDALFSSQSEPQQQVSAPSDKQEQPQQPKPQPQIAKTLQNLEDAIENISSGTKNHNHVQEAIVDLRHALQQSNLAPQELQEADTLLAVEAKRLESLRHKTP